MQVRITRASQDRALVDLLPLASLALLAPRAGRPMSPDPLDPPTTWPELWSWCITEGFVRKVGAEWLLYETMEARVEAARRQGVEECALAIAAMPQSEEGYIARAAVDVIADLRALLATPDPPQEPTTCGAVVRPR